MKKQLTALDLERYLEGDLSKEEKANIRDAMEKDADLRAEFESMVSENAALQKTYQVIMNSAPVSDGGSALEMASLEPSTSMSGSRLLLLAASILVAVGLGWAYQSFSHSNSTTPAEVATSDAFVFLSAENLDTDTPVAVLQRIDTMDMMRFRHGDAIGTATLEEVRRDGIVLQTGSNSHFYSVDDLRSTAEEAVDHEISGFTASLQAGSLTVKSMQRVIDLAQWGHAGSVKLLETIMTAGAYGPELQASAEACLGTLKKLQYLKGFIQRALNPESPRRVEMLKSLAEDNSLIARDTLYTIAASLREDEALRRMAIHLIAGYQDAWALRTLDALQRGLASNHGLQQELQLRKTQVLKSLGLQDGIEGEAN